MSDGPGDRRLPILVAVSAVIALAAVLDRTGASASASRRATLAVSADGPVVPRADAISTAWYCAEGTSAPGGRADETVVIADLGDHDARATVTVMPGGGRASAVAALDVKARSQASVRISDVAAVADPGVVVEVQGGPAVVEHMVTGNDDVGAGACATAPSPTWHFAAGTTVKGAQQWLALFNPFGDDAIVDLSFLTDQGVKAPLEVQGLVVPRRSRVTVPIHDHVRRQAQVATSVTARTGRVIAEQSLTLDGTDGRKGLALSLGAVAPRAEWVFPSGSAADGAAESLALANPGPTPATVRIDTRLDGEAELAPQTLTVPALSTTVTDLRARVPHGGGFWVDVRTTRGPPVVAEQLTVTGAPQRRALAETFGIPVPARRWVLALAGVDRGGIDVIVVVNPTRHAVRVGIDAYSGGRLDRLRADGPSGDRFTSIPPGQRAVIELGRLGVPGAAALVVEASGPVFVERADGGAPGLTLSPAVPDR